MVKSKKPFYVFYLRIIRKSAQNRLHHDRRAGRGNQREYRRLRIRIRIFCISSP